MSRPRPVFALSVIVAFCLIGCAGPQLAAPEGSHEDPLADVIEPAPEERPLLAVSAELDKPREEVICRTEKQLGSNLPKRTCYSKKNLEEVRDADRRRIEKIRFTVMSPH